MVLLARYLMLGPLFFGNLDQTCSVQGTYVRHITKTVEIWHRVREYFSEVLFQCKLQLSYFVALSTVYGVFLLFDNYIKITEEMLKFWEK